MKVPAGWLREYVDIELPLEELARQLVFTSCEVDRIIRRGVPDGDGNFDYFVVGRVLEAHQHPNADKLKLTKVDVGERVPRQIVCGARNFGAGATVAVVLPGALMPGGLAIEQRTLRGELSDGMILSERELELGQDHGGIMLLDDSLVPGTALADVLPLGDDVLEIETGNNRPDLTSVYGIAREVAALTGAQLKPLPGRNPEQAGAKWVDIRIEDLERCPVYLGRLFHDIRVGESPAWLKARLLHAGMRPISNVVDVTNYVMLALGNPLHAFDYAKLAGGRIIVRRARPGEKLVTLDGSERELDPEDLVIADSERPIAIGGVMGGERTEVSNATTEVLLEAANFEPLTVLRSGERHRMRTESQTRWEKGVDPYQAQHAIRYAAQLLAELAGGRWVGGGEDAGDLPAPQVIEFRPERAADVTGLEFDAPSQQARLDRLGFEVEIFWSDTDPDDADSNHVTWDVTVPSWRARDVRREIDLVEEVARFRLEDVPTTLPVREAMFGRLSHFQRLRRFVEDVLVGAGFYEAYTYSLQPSDPHPKAIELPVPLSSQQRFLRTTLVQGLLGAARHNVDMGNTGVRLFEVAHVYLPVRRRSAAGGKLPRERWHLGGIVDGPFADAKGVVEGIFDALKIEPRFERAQVLPLSPVGAKVQGGWVAQHALGTLDGEWSAFELDLEDLFKQVPERILYRDVITYPPLREDLAFVVAEGAPAGDLMRAAREAAGEELREVRFLSDYRGDPIPPGHKSVAFALVFQSPERTLSDEDAVRLRAAIVERLADEFDAELRA